MANSGPIDFEEFLKRIEKLADDREELFVAIAAFIISVVALLASLLQVAQQYYASAAGYSNCDTKVMGRWADTKKRVLRWTEFRFEVQFDAPVIFLCAPINERGPIAGAPIYFVTGDEQSLQDTWTTLPSKAKDEDELTKKSEKEREREKIHTADNERATWVTLLASLQQLEADSLKWQQEQYIKIRNTVGPPKENGQLPLRPPTLRDSHTLVVAIQRKRRSWDTMPAGVGKPYATTTMCHLVEMLAILGIHWVEFDRSHGRYRAEGNGYTVTGEHVSDLGLMFSFQVYGKSSYGPNRVIPVDEVKELCFGVAPTIYRETLDSRRLELDHDELRGMSLLQLGSKTDIVETLLVIGCNTHTVNYFTQPNMKHSHLFPVTFEILGMIGKTLHIENSCFRMLPNPTMSQWSPKSFSLRELFLSYVACFDAIEDVSGEERRNRIVIDVLKAHMTKIQQHLSEPTPKMKMSSEEAIVDLPLLNDLHKALDDMDEILTAKKRKPKQTPEPNIKHTATDLQETHKRTNSGLLRGKENETGPQRLRREMVQNVLRSHIQEVLKMINEKPPDENRSSPSSTNPSTDPKPQFEDLEAAAPEEKQKKLMEIYFKQIRDKVCESAIGASRRRGSVAPSPVGQFLLAQGIKRAPTKQSIAEDPTAPREGLEQPGSTTLTEDSETKPDMALYDLDVSHDDIWCILVLRMLCWLMLHDFHKKDIQNDKTELLGSRLPVYIG